MAHDEATRAPIETGGPPKKGAGLSTFASLANTDYRYLWIGNLFNAGGMWIQQITTNWLVWELSQSAFMVGLVSGLRALPFLFMGPIGGVLADRVDRRRLLMTSQTAMALVAIGFALVIAAHMVQVWHALVFSFVTGCGFAINQPVRQSLIANTVPRKHLGNAIALSALAANSTRIIGPAIGGVMIVAFGASWNFLLQAGLFLCMVVIIFPIKVRYREEFKPSLESPLRNMSQGFKYVWSNGTMFGLVILSFIPSLFVMPLIQILPVFTEEVLHSQSDVYGFMIAAFGVGGVIATLMMATFGSTIRSGLLGFLALLGSSAVAIAFSRSSMLATSIVLLGALGFTQMMFRVNNNTLVQTMAPDELRGRVMSIYQLDHAFQPLATFLLGLAAELYTAQSAVEVSAILGIIVALGLVVAFKRTRSAVNLRA